MIGFIGCSKKNKLYSVDFIFHHCWCQQAWQPRQRYSCISDFSIPCWGWQIFHPEPPPNSHPENILMKKLICRGWATGINKRRTRVTVNLVYPNSHPTENARKMTGLNSPWDLQFPAPKTKISRQSPDNRDAPLAVVPDSLGSQHLIVGLDARHTNLY